MQFLSPTAQRRWIQASAQKSVGEFSSLSLPSKLKSIATHVVDTNKGWEWKHYWLKNAQLYIQQKKLTDSSRSRWDATSDNLFEGWNKSEYAAVFLKKLNSTSSIQRASHAALKSLEKNLIQMAIRHFGIRGKVDRSLPLQFDLGEFPQGSSSERLRLDEEVEVLFHTWDFKNTNLHVEKISQALGYIKTFSPDSFQRFRLFTKSITPIRQRELVSYSLQTLPGHSFINLYNRDALDLMDDLLHENGHHQLNLFLMVHNPLREDPENIYYSPWRRTLRPIRGIFHAHFTFYFALKLYHDLAQHLLSGTLESIRPTTTAEKEKIFFRYLEEWKMLEYTSSDLKIAYRRGQINQKGMKLIQDVEKERLQLGSIYRKSLSSLSAAKKKKIQDLELTLKHQASITR